MKLAKRLFDSIIYYPIFRCTLLPMTMLARRRMLKPLEKASKLNANVVLGMRRAKTKSNIEEVGKEWARMFPNDMQQKIGQDGETVFYETHVKCPLRGTGDTEACYHTMEFDRAMLRKIGSEFVVLASQAEPERKTCIVAMTKSLAERKQLEDAHIRAKQGRAYQEHIPTIEIN